MEEVQSRDSDTMTIVSISSRTSARIQDLHLSDNEPNEKPLRDKPDSCRFEIPLHSETIRPEAKEKNVDRRRPGTKEKNEPGGYCKDSKNCLVF